jgi:hypothetical protein
MGGVDKIKKIIILLCMKKYFEFIKKLSLKLFQLCSLTPPFFSVAWLWVCWVTTPSSRKTQQPTTNQKIGFKDSRVRGFKYENIFVRFDPWLYFRIWDFGAGI